MGRSYTFRANDADAATFRRRLLPANASLSPLQGDENRLTVTAFLEASSKRILLLDYLCRLEL
jgi:hypothetical protein